MLTALFRVKSILNVKFRIALNKKKLEIGSGNSNNKSHLSKIFTYQNRLHFCKNEIELSINCNCPYLKSNQFSTFHAKDLIRNFSFTRFLFFFQYGTVTWRRLRRWFRKNVSVVQSGVLEGVVHKRTGSRALQGAHARRTGSGQIIPRLTVHDLRIPSRL